MTAFSSGRSKTNSLSGSLAIPFISPLWVLVPNATESKLIPENILTYYHSRILCLPTFLYVILDQVKFRFIFFCFTSHSTARVILRWVVYRRRKPVHTSWSRFCTANHWASASNYQHSNMKCPVRDSNQQPQRLKHSNRCTTEPPSHVYSLTFGNRLLVSSVSLKKATGRPG